MKEEEAAETGDEDVEAAVIIVIGSEGSVAIKGLHVESGVGGHVGEGSIAVVMVENGRVSVDAR